MAEKVYFLQNNLGSYLRLYTDPRFMVPPYPYPLEGRGEALDGLERAQLGK